MSSINFPNPRNHNFAEWAAFGEFYYPSKDIVGFGGELTVQNLKDSYSKGIFPWHIEGLPLPWFCPERRAILEFEDLHISKSLKKAQAKTNFEFTIDKDFSSVIKNCAKTKRSHESGTWITAEFIETYSHFHMLGEAHSIEVWAPNGEIVGGLYGVDAGGAFCGESMFYRESNASKLALLFLIDHLRSKGATWLDVQVMTPHMKILGAKEISRSAFLDKLEAAQRSGFKLF